MMQLSGVHKDDVAGAGVAEGRLRKEDCENFLQNALKTPLLPGFRFAALLTDFASIARGEGTSDLLLGYKL